MMTELWLFIDRSSRCRKEDTVDDNLNKSECYIIWEKFVIIIIIIIIICLIRQRIIFFVFAEER